MTGRSPQANQRDIVRLAGTASELFLEPVAPGGCGGNVEHYYHFLFDLALPIFLLAEQGVRSTLELKRFGIHTDRIRQLFPQLVRVVEEPTPGIRCVELVGMNPRCVPLSFEVLQRFARYLRSSPGVRPADRPTDVLLIERMPPDPYFLTRAVEKGSGTSRRSIPNHAELAHALRAATRDPFRFLNLQLETMTLADQVAYFGNAYVVVGQHGAGLANCIWMRPGSIVIELGCDASLVHFEIISRIMGHRFYRYATQGNHARVDVDHLVQWLREAGPGDVFR